jgi:cytochrome c-type biogenesis protein CcmF
MENLGGLCLLLAFCLGCYSVIAALVGAWQNKQYLLVSSERAVFAVWGLLATASTLLVWALMTGDFRYSYVASHSNKTMEWYYKFAAWWGGQEGSLLFWAFLLASYAAIVVFRTRRKPEFRQMMPYITAVLMTTLVFFTILITFVENPFKIATVGRAATDLGDGRGLDPILQYWTMVIHPPMLYCGYVGFVVPFAFAFASLVTKQPGDSWIHETRKWALVTWAFQSTGILLGAGWAYAVLGWGGYWNWDAVENASLLPWITSTAFLHSVMMQEKRGMMKIWNMVLVSATFFLCIFGTFLTRSGIVSSVHAFAQSSLGTYFSTFLALGIGLTVWVILARLPYLKTEAHLESVVSRESSFLFNNLILLASCLAVLWGTLFPIISEAATGEKISVDAPYFNKVNIPIGLFLLFLTGVGPLIAWRRSSPDALKRAFMTPTIAMVVCVAALLALGIDHPYALMCFGLCMFVTATITIEFWKGSRAIAAKDNLNLVMAAVELTHRNTRRYGGYIVHMGIVLMFIGFAGKAFDKERTVEVKPGAAFKLGNYELKVVDLKQGENENYAWDHAVVQATKHGAPYAELKPERRIYRASRSNTTEVAIRRSLIEDLYLSFAGLTQDGEKAIIQAYVFPLVMWIWIGYWVLLVGTLVCLVPPKVRMQYARTEVVGVVAKQPAPVEK